MKRDKNNNIRHYRLGTPISMASGKRLHRRGVGLIAGGVLIIVVVAVRIISAPAHGHNVAVDTRLQPKTTTPAASKLPAMGLQSAYFQMNLSAGYRTQDIPTASGFLYEQTLIKPSPLGSLIMAIVIKPLPDGGLSADPDYNLRIQEPSNYHLTSETINGDTVHLANDLQSASVVAFWPHGSYLATISVRSGLDNPGGDNSDELAALQPLLQAFHWR